MGSGEIQARHYLTGEAICLRWEGERITGLEASPADPPANRWLAPALIDLQINGFAGIDFQQDKATADDLLHAVRALQRHGCARFLLTLMTDSWPAMLSRLTSWRRLRSESPALRHAIAGWHIEGPFLSDRPGFCGAHNPALMLDPTPVHLQALRQAAGGDPVMLTLAPERPGAMAAIAEATALGMVVSLGHTNASTACLKEAVAAGARGFTHLGNGCPRELDRYDNILWRVLETEGLMVSLIHDTHHVSPPLFRFIHQLLPEEAIYYTTDAVSAAGASPGHYQVGQLKVNVGSDGIVRQPGSRLYAGSGLTPLEGLFRAERMLNGSWREVWQRATDHPARLMGWPSPLAVGASADFCLVQTTNEDRLQAVEVFVHGRSASQS